jgi:hypothetical protein
LFVGEEKENGLESTLNPRESDLVLYVSLDLALYAMTIARRASPCPKRSRECPQSKQSDQNAFLRGLMRSHTRVLVPASTCNSIIQRSYRGSSTAPRWRYGDPQNRETCGVVVSFRRQNSKLLETFSKPFLVASSGSGYIEECIYATKPTNNAGRRRSRCRIEVC